MVHVDRLTPAPALIFTCILSIGMLIPNDFDTLVNYFSFAAWMFYGLTAAAVVVLRFREPEKNWERPIKVPLVLPVIVVVVSIYLVIAPIIDDPLWAYLIAFAFILSGFIFYVPFVHYKIRLGFMDYITLFFQQLLQVGPSYYVSLEDEEKDKLAKE